MGKQPGDSEKVKVLVRVRPFVARELEKGDEEVIRVVGERAVQVLDGKPHAGRGQTATAYQFNQCFGTECTQDELFRQCGVAGLLDHVLEGYSATVFAYGPTGSGKTFTITGRPDNIVKNGSGDASDGVVIRSVEALFEKLRGLQGDGRQFKVRASCVEIYNESVVDLVNFQKGARGAQKQLPVRFDPGRGSFFVNDLTYGKCPNEEDLLRLYMKALRNRSVASHELNRDSSRSHALFTIYVDSMVQEDDGHITTRHGKITFVDLAGSERLKASKSEGTTLKETGAINKSIFTLGKVISTLCDRKKRDVVPYRDSKLTQLLMDSIGGTSLTVMLACVSPAASYLAESVRTLDYASRAKNIKNKPVVLLDEQNTIIQELKREVEALRSENKALRDALNTTRASIASAPERAREPDPSIRMLGETGGSMRHSVSSFNAHDLNRSSDSVLSFHDAEPSSQARGARRVGGGSPLKGRMVKKRAGQARPQNTQGMQYPAAFPGANNLSANSGKGGGGGGGGSFLLPDIRTSGRSREEIAAEERMLLGELDSAAKYSYFDQPTPSAYKLPSKPSALKQAVHSPPKDWEAEWAAKQRVTTSEQKLRQQILQLPEAEELPYQRRARNGFGTSTNANTIANSRSGGGLAGKGGRSDEQSGLRELDRLSKFSYFSDSRQPETGEGGGGGGGFPPARGHSGYVPQGDFGGAGGGGFPVHGGGGEVPGRQGREQRGSAVRWTPQKGSYEEVRWTPQKGSYEEVPVPGSREGAGGYAVRGTPGGGGGVAPASPKSVRSSGHFARAPRPSSADSDRQLERALEQVSTGGGGGGRGGGYGGSGGAAAGSSGASVKSSGGGSEGAPPDDWMAALNPLAGVDIDTLSGGGTNWEARIDAMIRSVRESSRSSDRSHTLTHASGPPTSSSSMRRPTSAGRPPSAPRSRPSSSSGRSSPSHVPANQRGVGGVGGVGQYEAGQYHQNSQYQKENQHVQPSRVDAAHGAKQPYQRKGSHDADWSRADASYGGSAKPSERGGAYDVGGAAQRGGSQHAPKYESASAQLQRKYASADPGPKAGHKYGSTEPGVHKGLFNANGVFEHPPPSFTPAGSSRQGSSSGADRRAPAHTTSPPPPPTISRTANDVVSGSGSYEAMMKNLEESRRKAAQARESILAKKAEWQAGR